MSPSLFQGFGIYECYESSSILATDVDDSDLADDWCELDKPLPSQWQILSPHKGSLSPASQWKSRLTSLSSSVIEAGTAFARHLKVGESTRRALSQLRYTFHAVSSHPVASPSDSVHVQHQFSEADIDDLNEMVDQPEREMADDEEIRNEIADNQDKLKKLVTYRAWTPGLCLK